MLIGNSIESWVRRVGQELRSWLGSERRGGGRGLLSQSSFREILRRERARVDRSNHGMSLCILTVSEQPELVAPVAEILAARTRLVDVLGWLNDAEIGVLLPDTPAPGARKVVRDVEEAMAIRGLRASAAWRIVDYAGGQSDGRRGDSAQVAVRTAADDSAAQRRSSTTGIYGALLPYLAEPMPRSKRLADLVLATVMLVLLSPLFLLVAALIKVVSPGPVFYRQSRVGYLGRPFIIWKFRTMHVQQRGDVHRHHVQALIDSNEPLTKLDRSDGRIIPFGLFLRVTAIDELPQLLNVLAGEMSLVGPRPDVPYAVDRYARWNLQRFDVVPGISGLWQVSGKNKTTHEEMMRLDIRYGRRRSSLADLRILFRTIPAIGAEVRDYLASARAGTPDE